FDGHAYGGSAARMFMLMDLLGEEPFWNAIKVFLNDFKFKNVDTDQFFDSVSKTTKRDLSQFKKQWFYTAAVPTLTLAKTGNDYTVSLPADTPFVLEVPIWTFQGQSWTKRKVVLGSTTKSLSLSGALGLVAIDPEVTLMTNVAYNVDYSDSD